MRGQVFVFTDVRNMTFNYYTTVFLCFGFTAEHLLKYYSQKFFDFLHILNK